MTVRAKFRCVSVEPMEEGANVALEPVYSGSAENEQFFKWTPSGHIEIGTINQTAADEFEVGKEYYIDFIAAD